MYILQRNHDGAFVSSADINPTGGSYTRVLQYAKVYRTREAALRDACGNESVRAVSDIMQGGY